MVNAWKGHTCSERYCNAPASSSVAVLPLCREHGMEVAHEFAAALIAEHELKRLKEATEHTENRQTRRGNREGSRVYYARIGDYIKIGYTTRLRNRLATLRVDELLAIEPGGAQLERARHQEFIADRIDLRRENFRPSEALIAHIEALRDEHGLPQWASLPRTSEITHRHKEGA